MVELLKSDASVSPQHRAVPSTTAPRCVLAGRRAALAAEAQLGRLSVPTVIRWPGTIRPGTVYNEMFSHYDLIPTFAAAGGDPDIVDKCRRGAQIGNKTFKVHLDGFNLIPFFKGEAKEAPRKEFVYWNDDGQIVAIRVYDWKSVFLEQNNKGIGVWSVKFTDLRIPKLFNLRSDPFERGDGPFSITSGWRSVPSSGADAGTRHAVPLQEFPVRQKPASFNPTR